MYLGSEKYHVEVKIILNIQQKINNEKLFEKKDLNLRS